MPKRSFQASTLAMLVCSACASLAVAQTETPPSDAPAPAKKPADAKPAAPQAAASAPEKLQIVEVTGSRLRNGDVTSSVTIISAEEIEARGVSSVEELLRTLPQNLATIGDITSQRGRGPLANRTNGSAVSELGRLGVSAANLGGMGAGNTLVLVNGRRMAGAAGIEDGFVNLNGIPLSAIERVEITQGGSSAVYGADAMAGVINFILKKNFTGTTVSARYEHSNNGAHQRRAGVTSGYSWDSGSVSGTLDFSTRKPVINAKTGYVTQNYASYYNGDSNYDRRSLTYGLQPGVISTPDFVYDPVTTNIVTVPKGLTLPAGFTGRPAISDFITVGAEAMRDYVPRTAGSETESLSTTLNLEQRLPYGLKLFANGLFTRTQAEVERVYGSGLTVELAPGQYYNPFPAEYFNDGSQGARVSYYPGDELATGELPSGTLKNVTRSWVLSTGATWDINADTRADLIFTTSRNGASGRSSNLGSLVSLVEDATAPNGVSCYNFQLSNPLASIGGVDRAAYQAAFDRQCAALTSSDPNIAFNPFKSSAKGGGASVSTFLYEDAFEQRGSRMKNLELRVNGRLATLASGNINYAAGAEYNDDGVNSNEVNTFTGVTANRKRHAVFGEITVPLLGRDRRLPFAHALALNLAARKDTYTSRGAIGTVNNVSVANGGELIIGKSEFSRTTPAFGLMWQPVDTVTVRAKRTQGFKAPPFTQLYSQVSAAPSTTIITNDPGYTCTTDCVRGRQAYLTPSIVAPNPNLRPETSTQNVVGIKWVPQDALSGLNLSATWSSTEIKNQYARTRDLNRLLSQNEILMLPQFYERDATGKIVLVRNMPFNIVGSKYASVTYEAGYVLQTSIGGLEPRITVVDNLKSETKGFEGGKPVSFLGKLQGPDRYKVVSSLGWYRHDMDVMLWAYYTPSYTNDYESITAAGIVTNPTYAKPVDKYLTFDLSASVKINNRTRLSMAARNLFDAKPPFVVVDSLPYDTARYNVAGRTVSMELSYSF